MDAQLDEISKRPIYGFYAQLMAYAITSSMFTLFFGGAFVDAFWSFWIGPLLKITAHHLTKLRTNPFFKTIYLSLFMTNKMGQAKLFVGLQNYIDFM